jgi:uncharacterized phage-associated protein
MNKNLFEQEINEVILYISQKVNNMYHILKIIYYANQEHFYKNGCFFINDNFLKEPEGPTPSVAWDIIKFLRDSDSAYKKFDIKADMSVSEKYFVKPKRKPNMDFLSESSRECLDNAIKKYGRISKEKLMEISHKDQAYINTKMNHIIKPITMAQYAPNKKELIEHLSMR